TELIAATRAERAHRIELGPLSRAESDQLMAGEEVGEGWRASLHAQSGGNPFYLEQLLRSRRLEAERPSGPGTGPFGGRLDTLSGRISEEVAVTIAREVDALPWLAQAVLQAAAVAGEPFEPDLVAEIADVAEPDALLSLDELQARDLIRPTAVAREFRFRHPLVRAAVYGSLKGGWRVAAHARAARALARRGASAAACAPHVAQSARRGDDEAISLLVEAARAATGRAPASAARWLAAAARLAPERGPGSERRLELMPELAGAFASIGALEQCQEVLVQALDVLPEAIDELRTALIAGCAQAEIFLGRYEQARARLVRAIDEVGDEISPARVQLELALAAYGTYANDLDLAVRFAASARAHASALGRQALHATALSILSLSSYAAGEIEDAQDAHSSACALVDELSDGSISRRVEMMWFLGWAGWFLGRYGTAEAHFSRGIAVSRAYGDARLLIEMTVGRTIALTWLGRLGEAVALGEEALEAGQLSNSPNRLMWCNIARCLSLTAAGDLDAALRAGEEAAAIAREVGVSVVSAGAGWTCAAVLIEAGEHQRAVDVLLELLGGPGLSGYYAGMRPFCYGLLTRAEMRRGNAAGAREWARRSAASAYEIGLAQRAIEGFDRTGAPINAARARLVAGKALGAAGDRERAGAELRRAEQSFAEFGARRLQAEAVRELRRIGRRVRSTGRRGAGGMGGAGGADKLASLSGREREVAELVTARKTNREIAADLYLSEKTIESHLSSVFVKLGVNSRADVARAVERNRAQRRVE
ncbi:MAG TPA: LuxR C-terminal-related transcriptional regulator, partial [Solirubrobacteraceae bacterium]|nr:LuxR C-terminal-related transcriptional regulator [Solirubrobacteraceae bacterium]